MVLIGICLCKQTPFRHNLSRIQTSGIDFITQASSMAASMILSVNGSFITELITLSVTRLQLEWVQKK